MGVWEREKGKDGGREDDRAGAPGGSNKGELRKREMDNASNATKKKGRKQTEQESEVPKGKRQNKEINLRPKGEEGNTHDG